MILKDLNIDTSWTLFLDRDGVINKKKDNDYVRNVGEFIILDGVKQAIERFSGKFSKILVVTNQQGVGKDLMTLEELNTIHEYLLAEISQINKIYTCTHLISDNCTCRKPLVGLGLLAKQDFEYINFKKAIMIGDSESDISFGKKLEMKTIFIGKASKNADYTVNSLSEVNFI